MYSSRMRTVRNSSRLLWGVSTPPPLEQAPPRSRHLPAARHAGIPPAMHAGIAHPPPREQNQTRVKT